MPVKDTASVNVNGTGSVALNASYEAPVLIKHGSLRELTLEEVPVSGGGGSPWEGFEFEF
jgi:hypothetical protein